MNFADLLNRPIRLDSITPGQDKVVSVQNDADKINAARALVDLHEMPSVIGALRQGKTLEEAIKIGAQQRANLAQIDGKICFVGVQGNDIWHELGTVVSEAMTSEECLHLAGLDYLVEKRTVQLDSGVIVPGVWSICRVDKQGNAVPFNNVSAGDRFEVVQNSECFAFLDEILGQHGAHYSTAGALADGCRTWITAQLPDVCEPIPGDETRCFWTVSNAHDGTEAIRCFGSHKRPVCQNTVRLNWRRGKRFLSAKHTKNVRTVLHKAAEHLADTRKEFGKYCEAAACMAKTNTDPRKFADDTLDLLADKAEPGKTPKSLAASDAAMGAELLAQLIAPDVRDRVDLEKTLARKIKTRQTTLDEILNREASGTNTARGTVWGAFQSVTEQANHGIRYRGQNARENRFDSIMSGRADELNQAAYATALRAIAS